MFVIKIFAKNKIIDKSTVQKVRDKDYIFLPHLLYDFLHREQETYI